MSKIVADEALDMSAQSENKRPAARAITAHFALTKVKNCLNLLINYDSGNIVTREGHSIRLPRQQVSQGLALAVLLLMGGMALAGPSGFLAWSENLRLLDERKAQIAALETDYDSLRNRVDLLHPDHADADMVGEQLRREFNVVHEDEVVLILDDK